jgi:hypothetical protein
MDTFVVDLNVELFRHLLEREAAPTVTPWISLGSSGRSQPPKATQSSLSILTMVHRGVSFQTI